MKEANILSQLNHPYIIKVKDVFQENNTSYYVMEYIDGLPLSAKLDENGPLPEKEAIRIVEKLGSALIYLHDKHINHLDIKPSNIMLDEGENRVVLIDFGVSKQYDPNTGDGTTTTPVGVSNGYSPIEQYNSGGVSSFSPQSDIYALGATLYKMLTGITPPNAIDLSQSGVSLPSNISSHVSSAIKNAMQPVMKNRPASMAEFLRMLTKENADEETLVVDKKTVVVDIKNNRKNHSHTPVIWWIVGLLIVGGIIFYFAKNKLHNPSQIDGVSNGVNLEQAVSSVEKEEEPDNKMIATKIYAKKKPGVDDVDNEISFEYPTTGNSILLNNVREWINEKLGGTYDGDLENADGMLAYYYSKLNDPEMSSSITIKKLYENDVIVTYIAEHEFLMKGGAHGGHSETGTTFRKSDGKVFSNEMVSKSDEMQDLVRAGLKRYFDVYSDEDLMDMIDSESLYGYNNIPLPSANPWITPNGVVFRYAEYEIAAYAYGQPSFVIPNHTIVRFLSATGKTFFE